MDLDCFDDITPFADELDDPLAELVQDVYHILIEAPGSNIDDPARGIGIVDRLSRAVDQTLASHIDAELEKDDRIDVSQTVIADRGGGRFEIAISIHYDDQVLDLAFSLDATGFHIDPVGG